MNKTRFDELAVNGAAPAFTEPLHVGRPNVGDRQKVMARIESVLESGWLTNDGRNVQAFERALAEELGVAHCVVTCNGTQALSIAARAAGLGQEVIVPAFTFVATPHALQWQGMTPVFCDVDSATHNIDPSKLDELVSERTTGILGVHLWGRACDVEGIAAVAKRRGVKVIYDAAAGVGCAHRGRSLAHYGDAAVYSFHATKILNSIEGGAIATRDGEIAERARLMRNFGFADYDRVTSVGTNAKMTEVSAITGMCNLEHLSAFIDHNRRNYHRYREGVSGMPGVRLVEMGAADRHNHHYAVLEVDEKEAGIDRDALQKVLWAENVLARRYFAPGCHRHEPYCSQAGHVRSPLDNTDRLSKRVLVLPTGMAVDETAIPVITQVLRTAVAHGAALRECLDAAEAVE